MNNAELHRREDDDLVSRKIRLLTDSISKVGFPIVMSLILVSILVYVIIWEIPKITKSNSEDSAKMVNAISQNTEVMQSMKRFLTKRYD